ncbi:hypothetical protein M758_8G018000 [Ceratodon purpureus]|nr:hypothetical protein M758_8G018000 [Ceratodon purpureus]
MARYNYYDGRQVPQYYYYPSSSDLAPMRFLDSRRPEYYQRAQDDYVNDSYRRHYRVQDNSDYLNDGYRRHYRVQGNSDYVNDGYRRHYRLQDNSDYSRHGHMPEEQVVRREGGDVTPWLLNREYPNYGGYAGMYQLPQQPWQYGTTEDSSYSMTVEMYVPLCCDECERKVRKHLKNVDGTKLTFTLPSELVKLYITYNPQLISRDFDLEFELKFLHMNQLQLVLFFEELHMIISHNSQHRGGGRCGECKCRPVGEESGGGGT